MIFLLCEILLLSTYNHWNQFSKLLPKPDKIDHNGLHPLDYKVKAIVEATAPRNVTELKSYLGLLNYYGRFLPNLSTTLAPLHYLLKKGIVFSWGKQQTKAFEASKQLLTSSKVACAL